METNQQPTRVKVLRFVAAYRSLGISQKASPGQEWHGLARAKCAADAQHGPAVKIPLTQGQSALVSVEDLPLLSLYRWTAIRSRNTWYA
jgi:hypothetical protein